MIGKIVVFITFMVVFLLTLGIDLVLDTLSERIRFSKKRMLQCLDLLHAIFTKLVCWYAERINGVRFNVSASIDGQAIQTNPNNPPVEGGSRSIVISSPNISPYTEGDWIIASKLKSMGYPSEFVRKCLNNIGTAQRYYIFAVDYPSCEVIADYSGGDVTDGDEDNELPSSEVYNIVNNWSGDVPLKVLNVTMQMPVPNGSNTVLTIHHMVEPDRGSFSDVNVQVDLITPPLWCKNCPEEFKSWLTNLWSLKQIRKPYEDRQSRVANQVWERNEKVKFVVTYLSLALFSATVLSIAIYGLRYIVVWIATAFWTFITRRSTVLLLMILVYKLGYVIVWIATTLGTFFAVAFNTIAKLSLWIGFPIAAIIGAAVVAGARFIVRKVKGQSV